MKHITVFLIPILATLGLLFLGLPDLAVLTISWLAFGICAFFLGVFKICFWGLSLENSPLSRAVWPVMATDFVLFNRFQNLVVVSSMLIVSLIAGAPIVFPLFFALSDVAVLMVLLDYAADIYMPLIEPVEEKHGADMYEDDNK